MNVYEIAKLLKGLTEEQLRAVSELYEDMQGETLVDSITYVMEV